MKTLYHVEITVMVMASDEEEAKHLAVSNAMYEDCEVSKAVSVPSEWYNCMPWGSGDERTCGQILKDQRAAEQTLAAELLSSSNNQANADQPQPAEA